MNLTSLLYTVLCLVSLASGNVENGLRDGSQKWGYVEVRPKSHLFWWSYRSLDARRAVKLPTILWLQGGPGYSAARGDFLGIGPMNVHLKTRNHSWLQIADLLFVDHPVGVGYSYTEARDGLARSDEVAASDLLTLLKSLYTTKTLESTAPLYIVGESYGGKIAVVLALQALAAKQAGNLINFTLAGIVLGSSWNSPKAYASLMAPLLKDVSRIDENGLEILNRLALQIKTQLGNDEYMNATDTYLTFISALLSSSHFVDITNFLVDKDPTGGAAQKDLEMIMNHHIKKKLGIIPRNIKWKGFHYGVFEAMKEDYMKDNLKEVDELLAKGIQMTVYNGQLDIVCSPSGAEAWIKKLRWKGMNGFRANKRRVFHCGQQNTNITAGFIKSHQHFRYYVILGAGHYVPTDRPCAAFAMMASIVNSTVV